MSDQAAATRLILCDASSDAFAPKTREILGRLGYALIDPGEWEVQQRGQPEPRLDLLLLDDRRLGESEVYQEEEGDPVPIVLLSGRHGATGADSRVVGAVKRPAGLHDLYRLIQQIFEDTPRSTPRIATQIRARCGRGEHEWDGRVLSLSENGCLIRSPELIPLGQKIKLDLMLPQSGPVSLDAEAAYQLLPDVGLVFNRLSPAHRETLGRFVAQALLAAV